MTSFERQEWLVRKLARIGVVALGVTATGLFVPDASAFELFGYTILGDDKKATDEDDNRERLPYSAELSLTEEDDGLKESLDAASALVSRVEEPPPGSAALLARARTDRKRLVSALYANGRYGGTVSIKVAGKPLERVPIDADLTPDAATGKVPVEITVDAGPQFHFDETRIVVENRPADANASDNPADYELMPGELAGSTKIVSAGDKIVANWRNDGYALAKIADKEIVADHATKTIDVTFYIAPGQLARFGSVSVEGTEEMDPDFIMKMADIEHGKRYDPKELAKAQKRLRELGVFDAVRIRQAEQLEEDGSLPLIIEVKERKRRFVGAGASYSTTEGVAFELYFGHRNLFGQAERIRFDAAVGRIGANDVEDLDYSFKIAFAKPGVFGPSTEFTTDLFAIHEEPDAYTRTAAGGAIGFSYRFSETLSAKAAVSAERSQITDALGKNNYLLVGLPVALNYDGRDNKLDPTKGFHAAIRAEPLYDTYGEKAFFLTEGMISAYRAVDSANRFVLAGRVAIGSALGARLRDIPADRRFYLGGGDTIRGYAYQNVGPHLPGGAILGGLSYFTMTGEVRTRVTDTIGLVGFVDAGNAYLTRFPEFSDPLKVGVGGGLRYLTPVGPLRLDVAVPLQPRKDDPDVALYVGIGQSF